MDVGRHFKSFPILLRRAVHSEIRESEDTGQLHITRRVFAAEGGAGGLALAFTDYGVDRKGC